MISIEEARIVVCSSGKRLLQEGLVARTWGNVSVKVSDRHMVITPSGRKYEELTPADMVVVDFYTLAYEGKIKPSSELKLHSKIYQTRPHIEAVIHTHQMYVSIVASAQKDLVVIKPEHRGILGAPVIHGAPYALPNSKSLVFGTEKAIQSSNAALMSNHGCVCIGKNLEDAFLVCKTLEEACAAFIDSFKPRPILV